MGSMSTESILRLFRDAGAEQLPRRRMLQILEKLGADSMESFGMLMEAYQASKADVQEEALQVSSFLRWLSESETGTQDHEAAVVEDLAYRGVSLKSLLGFMRQLPELMPHYDIDTTRTVDVVWQVIVPQTAARGCAYAELLTPASASSRRLPDKMISHNWGNRFAHLMAALFADAAGKTSFKTILAWMRLGATGLDLIEAQVRDAGQLDSTRWLCIFAVNQHISICDKTWNGKDAATGKPYKPCTCGKEKIHSGSLCEMNKFDAMIALFKARHPQYEHVLAVDEGLELLTRIWVIAEIAEVFRNKLPCKVAIAEPRGTDLFEKVKALDVRDAEASRPEDVDMILAKIEDKAEFNNRTRSALMVVAHFASLELRVEMRYHLRGLASPEAHAEYLASVESTRQKLREADSLEAIQEVWKDFERENNDSFTDNDQRLVMHFCDMTMYCDLMQPELFLRCFRDAKIPQAGYRPDMQDEDISSIFWMMRAAVRNISQLPHVYMDGPEVMAALAKSRRPEAAVICITVPPKSEHIIFKMGQNVQLTETRFPTHLVTLVHKGTDETMPAVTLHRGWFGEPPVLFEGPFQARELAAFIVDKALPSFGVLHEANRVHYMVKATAGLLVLWLRPGIPEEELRALARRMEDVAGSLPDLPCCLLDPTRLAPKALERFLRAEEAAPAAILFLGNLKSRGASPAVTRYLLPLELPMTGPERLLEFVRDARSGAVQGEEVASKTPLLGETFLTKPAPQLP